MLSKTVKYLVLNDIHLGHRKNKTEVIVNHLDKYFLDNNKLFSSLDIIFIAGDIFERLLNGGTSESELAMAWLTRLIKYCSKRNIKLRILEGTPSHDFKQARVLTKVINELNIDIDFKYIDTLSIEIINDYELSILYVPDEWSESGETTLQDVKQLLADNNLTKVDIAIMHGFFHYQLPQITLESGHDEKSYLDIVNYLIHIGHIHSHSIFERIIAGGSFDRLAHNEEESKGGIYTVLRPNNKYEYVFIPNKYATIFKTLDIDGMDINNVLKEIKKIVSNNLDTVNVRLSMSKQNSIKGSLDFIKSQIPNANIIENIKKSKEVEISEENALESISLTECIKITKDNIKELLYTEMMKYDLPHKDLQIMEEELEDVI